MTRATDVVVIGGGIAGLTVVLELARQGKRVVLVAEPRPGEASGASAGLLAASLGFPAHLAAIARAARDLYPAFLAELAESSGVAVACQERGLLEVADGDRAPAHGGDWIDAGQLARLEPALAGLPGAWLHADDGAVDAGQLMAALVGAVARRPEVERITSAATALRIGASEATVITAEAGRIVAGRVVLAGGAWAGHVAGLPRPLPVRPLAGQLLRVRTAPPSRAVYGAGGYLVARGTSTLVGATSDDVGFATDVTAAGGRALRSIAARLMPGSVGAVVESHWAGLRPMSPDGLPILGPDPQYGALLYACGYSRNGILLAPWAARALAATIDDAQAPDLTPFRVDRFAG